MKEEKKEGKKKGRRVKEGKKIGRRKEEWKKERRKERRVEEGKKKGKRKQIRVWKVSLNIPSYTVEWRGTERRGALEPWCRCQ